MEAEGNTSTSSIEDSGQINYQYFRSDGLLVRLNVTQNKALNIRYVYWSDLRICFPGIIRVQHGDVVMTFMRNESEHRLKPFRIEYVPGETLDVIYGSSLNGRRSNASRKSSARLSMLSGHSNSIDNVQPRENSLHDNDNGELRHTLESQLVYRNRNKLPQLEDLTPQHFQAQIQQLLLQQIQQHKHNNQQSITESSTVESISPPMTDGSGLNCSSECDIADKHSDSLESIEMRNSPPILTVTVEASDIKSGSSASSPMLNIENTNNQGSVSKIVGSTDKVHGQQQEKPDISIIRTVKPPNGANEETVAEFEVLRKAVIFCFKLFYSSLKSTTEYQLLHSDKRYHVLLRTLKQVDDRVPQDHALRHQLNLLKWETIRTRKLFRSMRSELLQSKADQITGTHVGILEHLEQSLFVILPESDTSEDGFRLHFLCECCQVTKLDHDSLNGNPDDKSLKDGTGLPHRIHISKHEGYKLRYTGEFVARYGYHMWILLQLIHNGYDDHGVTVPAIAKGTPLHRRVVRAINYIESEPDSGDIDGSWDFTRVSEFYVPVSVSKEGSVGSLFRIITKEGYAKWVCFEHYRERFPENDYQILRKTLKTFFYNEALGAVLVNLGSREEANEFYEAIVKAKNLQELGIELGWGVDVNDIDTLQAMLPRTTAISIKILLLREHHRNDKIPISKQNEQYRASVPIDDNYSLGHFKAKLIKQMINDQRIQAFYLGAIDHFDHSDYDEYMNLALRNTTSFDNWNPDKANPALCDMVRTSGPKILTKVSFHCPSLERGSYFLVDTTTNNDGIVTAMAIVSSRELLVDHDDNSHLHRSIRLLQWTSNQLKFTNMERLWLDVRTPRDTGILQQVIEKNPCLEKLKVTTETNTFYKIYEAVQKGAVARTSGTQLRLVLQGGGDMSLSWSEVVVPPERKQDQVISLEYSAGASNINTVLMFFGYMVTHLKCLDLTNMDVKTLEACTRSRGSNIMHLEVNILGLSKKGLEDLSKVVHRSLEPMSQLSSRFSIHLCPVAGVQPDLMMAADFLILMGPRVDEIVIYNSNIDNTAFESLLERITPKELFLLESLIVIGDSCSVVPKPIEDNMETISSGSITPAVALAGISDQGTKKSHPASTYVKTESADINPTDLSVSHQFSKKFLPWLQRFISELPLQKVGLNNILLETEEWRSVLSKIDFSELQILDLKGSIMTMAMFYELPSHFPTYDKSSTTPSPLASCHVNKRKEVWSSQASPSKMSSEGLSGLAHLKEYYRDASSGISDAKAKPILSGARTTKTSARWAVSERRFKQTVKPKDDVISESSSAFVVVPREEEIQAPTLDQRQYAPEKRHSCSVFKVQLPSILDYNLGRYEKNMIQNAIRASLIGCEVD
ncbi:hypothetical protein BGZ76_010259 [Entomortierella beljakovae]|nr:hypothetical protein BGZ76_010259 [Entomortierella beljakovae]